MFKCHFDYQISSTHCVGSKTFCKKAKQKRSENWIIFSELPAIKNNKPLTCALRRLNQAGFCNQSKEKVRILNYQIENFQSVYSVCLSTYFSNVYIDLSLCVVVIFKYFTQYSHIPKTAFLTPRYPFIFKKKTFSPVA